MRKKRFTMAATAAIVLLAAAQFYRPQKTNPPADAGASFEAVVAPPAHVAAAVRRSCGNCHSNQTVWPWYSHVAPASWLVARDVAEGRAKLNLSEWGFFSPSMSRSRIAVMCSEVKDGKMPPPYYSIPHPGSKMTAHEAAGLCALGTQTMADH